MQVKSFESVEKAYRQAFFRGGAMTTAHAELDVSLSCERPVESVLHHGAVRSTVTGERVPPRIVEVYAPCRRCASCLSRRSWQWSLWAKNELAHWPRSYLVTLTLSPDSQALASFEVERQCVEESVDPRSLGDEEFFLRKCECIGQDATRYVKRVRKRGLRLRYMLVAERHRSGNPHMHMLVHELERMTGDAWDTAQLLKGEWLLGHADVSGVDRVDTRAATYLCKYLSKSMLARVRASLGYGRWSGERIHERDTERPTAAASERRASER